MTIARCRRTVGGKSLRLLGPLLGLLCLDTPPAEACSAGGAAPQYLVRHADVIVRAMAIDAVTDRATSPLDPPSTKVRFVILEHLKGSAHLFDLAVRGSLVEHADFNDHPVPYGFVRRQGRGGSCFANTYQAGGEYVLILKRIARPLFPLGEASRATDELAPYWAPLSATNEQILGADDPWVVWVRQEIARIK